MRVRCIAVRGQQRDLEVDYRSDTEKLGLAYRLVLDYRKGTDPAHRAVVDIRYATK